MCTCCSPVHLWMVESMFCPDLNTTKPPNPLLAFLLPIFFLLHSLLDHDIYALARLNATPHGWMSDHVNLKTMSNHLNNQRDVLLLGKEVFI